MHRRVLTLVLGALILWPAAAGAQSTFRRGWFDVNLGLARPAESSFDTVTVEPHSEGESQRATVTYHLPAGAAFDFGGGVMITPVIGLGVSFTGTAHRKSADLEIEVPHPFFFNAFARDGSFTDEALTRSEGGFSIQVMVVAVERGKLRLRVFGGPTWFRVEQESVDRIQFDQSLGIFVPTNTVRITRYEARTVDGSGWGAHAGADVSYFLSEVVGLGAYGRYMGGSVDIDNALGQGTVSVKAGGVQVGGGLRLRF